jgi:hypothetical protein
MKQIPLLMTLALALSLCNLTERFTGKKSEPSNSNSASSNSSGVSSPTSTTGAGGDQVETPQPTAAETAALIGGQTVVWDEQGINWTLPPKWNKMNSGKEMYQAGGGGGFLIANIAPMAESFPVDASLKAMYDSGQTEYKNGKYEEVRWMSLDGVKGVLTRESMPEDQSDPRRLQWRGYRKYAGQTQYVSIIISTSGRDFAGKKDAFYGTMYSTKIVH